MGLQKANALLTAISNAQAHLMFDVGDGQLFENLLADFLALTESECGFIGEVLREDDVQSSFKMHAHQGIAWREAAQDCDQAGSSDEALAAVLLRAETLIENHPTTNFCNLDLHEGCVSLNAILALPVMSGGNIVGMICLANRDIGYDQTLIDYLKPLTETYGRIIELTRANKGSHKSEGKSQRLRQALDQVYDNVFFFDSQTLLFTYANQAAIKQLGYSPDELYRMRPVDIKPLVDEAQFLQIIKPLLDGEKESLTFSTVHRNKSGTDFPVEIVLQYVLSDAQRPHFVAIVRDMTDRFASEKALRDSDERLRRSQVFANIGTWDWDIQTGELYWSERIGPLFGYEEGVLETSYENFIAAIHPEDRQAVIDAVTACVERGEEYNIEHRSVWPDGTVRWMLERGDVVRDEQGKALRMLGVVHDVTELKNVELDLVAAKEEAESASSAKTDFLSSMSHELRTPLNAIMGFAQLFSYDRTASEQHKEAADEIYRAGKHLRTLIDDILNLAKIESGQFTVSLEAVSIVDVIEGCCKLIQPLAEEKDVMLGMKLGQCRNISVLADRTRLKQVLLNLLSNAIKYNRDHGSVTLSCERRANDRLIINVSDTGLGIAAKDLNYVFKPFSRLVDKHKDVEGSGIGLSISRQFVELMHGNIGVESEPDKGSTFWVDLKVIESTANDSEIAHAGTEMQQLAAPAKDKSMPRIVLIEDNPTNRTVFNCQLRALGYEAEIVNGPEAVLANLKTSAYDLILTDIHMPGMSGYELARYVREAEQGTGRHTPIVAITANVLDGEQQRCFEAGMDGYISKPVDINVLKKTIRRWLDGETAEIEPTSVQQAASLAAELDISRLSEMVSNDVEKQDVIRSFLQAQPEALVEIHSAFDSKDAAKLDFWAHRFKSSTSAIGADVAANICGQIELLAKENDLTATVPLIEKLERQVEVLEERLKQILREMEENQTKAAIKKAIETNIGSVLVVDDDLVVQGMMLAALRGLGIANVYSASSGREGLALMKKNNNDIDVVICDLKMPEMDGVEYLRHLVSCDYRGAIILLSGEDSRILNSARQLANAHSFYFVAALQKPVGQLELAGVLAKINRKQVPVAKPLPSKVSLQELEKAIAEDQFVVYYQPKIDTYSKQLLGVESLVRWQHPEKGFVMPDDFIPLAEENGLIDALTDLVVDTSFAQLSRWRSQGIDITVSINIAVGTIGRRIDFPECIMKSLAIHQLEPQNVILELTESGLMGDLATSLDALVRLRLKGVNLSIDDFGTGYSTFRQLQGIPFTELKIDKGFVMNAGIDISSRAILESSILLGQKLGMTLVAEGVESLADWQLLKKLGCHVLQGFHISRPMPGEQLEGWLKEWKVSMTNN